MLSQTEKSRVILWFCESNIDGDRHIDYESTTLSEREATQRAPGFDTSGDARYAL
ncbi:hypothetical protein KSX_07420 [Ktedonospora formicarum]|uniref:Uncharacterized protein n=1 Tax=Ktedonospora formicarum TaxID=2778364 RepID=A0A8J3I0E5_9CHLR|nr:hypothetical protein KSX_07420 [Ktedonospora formicarum]